jgi:hypothetical protein
MKRSLVLVFAAVLSILLALPTDAISRGGGYGGSRGYGGHSSGYKGYKSSYGKSYKSGSSKSYHSYRRGKSGSHGLAKTSYSSVKYGKPILTHPGVARDSQGRIERSASAKQEFLRNHGLKSVPKGYEVDHIVPLYAGGRDDPSNMQLLTTQQHEAKTKADYQRYGR